MADVADPMEAHLRAYLGREQDVTVRLARLQSRPAYTGTVTRVDGGLVTLYEPYRGYGSRRQEWTFRVADVVSVEEA